jgi:MFS family permease
MPLLEAPRPPVEEISLSQEGSILKNASFMSLWWSQVLSQLADRIIFVVFVAYITHLYGGDERFTSYLYVAFTIPAILLTAVAGVFVDRWPRRLTLVVINVMRGLLVFALPQMAEAGLAYLYVLAFLLSSITQFFVPAESATIPTIVPKSQLLSANSLFTTTMMASVIVGFALGDPLIEWFGLEQVHWALSLLFMGAAACLVGLRLDPHKALIERVESTKPRTFSESMQRFSAELREGFSYIREHSAVWHAMAKLALLFSAVVAMCILSITFSKNFLYVDASVASRKFAYIVASSGLGMALGAMLVTTALKRVPAPLTVYSGMLLLTFGLVGMAFVPQCFTDLASSFATFTMPNGLAPLALTDRMAWTYFASIVMGVGAATVAIPLQAFLHDCIPEAIRGKVLGVQFTMLSTSSTLPALIAGLSSHFMGVQAMMLCLALPFALWGGYGFYLILFKKMRAF